MLHTNALYRDNDPSSKYPKSIKGNKWKWLLRTICDNRKDYQGQGIAVIPCDPSAFIERLDLLLSSKEMGNTGVRNELVNIHVCDELKRQGVIDSNAYK